MLHNSDIWIITHDLNYEKQPDKVRLVSRKQFFHIIAASKLEHARYYSKRITAARAEQEIEIIEREAWKKQYDKRIMEKYNVGPDYGQNRWFMEQVRPTYY